MAKTKQLMNEILEKIEGPTTCQICGRPIKSSTGLIAHHGYKRPGSGWQTASCIGARHLPYEVSCDFIPVAIASVKAYIDRTEIALALHFTFPPNTLHYTRGSWNKERIAVERPANFEPFGSSHRMRFHKYDAVFDNVAHEMKRGIEFAKRDLEYLTKRLADWKPLE